MRDDIRQEGAHDAFLRRARVLQDLADACRSDEDRLREVEERPKGVLREHGVDVPMNVNVNVVLKDHDVFHLVLPPDPNQKLHDEALMAVAGGGKTASTVGSIGSVGTIPSTLGTLGTAGSVGSAAPGSPSSGADRN